MDKSCKQNAKTKIVKQKWKQDLWTKTMYKSFEATQDNSYDRKLYQEAHEQK